jgi:hypothetical protein
MLLSNPDPPARHHLPFDKPIENLRVLSEAEGLRCLRSLLPLPSQGQACGVLLDTPQSSLLRAPAVNRISHGVLNLHSSDALLVIRNIAEASDSNKER